MDNYKQNIISFLEKSKEHINNKNLIIIFLILYISGLSIYTPRHIIAFVNHPLSKILIVGLILYLGSDNLFLVVLISIALLISINLDNSLRITEEKMKKNYNEHFKINSEDEDDEDEDEDEDEEDSIRNPLIGFLRQMSKPSFLPVYRSCFGDSDVADDYIVQFARSLKSSNQDVVKDALRLLGEGLAGEDKLRGRLVRALVLEN